MGPRGFGAFYVFYCFASKKMWLAGKRRFCIVMMVVYLVTVVMRVIGLWEDLFLISCLWLRLHNIVGFEQIFGLVLLFFVIQL